MTNKGIGGIIAAWVVFAATSAYAEEAAKPRVSSAAPANYGIASVYNDRQTASGELMNPRTLIAAHRSFRFGTMVRVTNRRNGRVVVVRIIDRGPYIRGRVIDLSPAAAKVLGISGLAPVVLAVVETKA